jgi:integrase
VVVKKAILCQYSCHSIVTRPTGPQKLTANIAETIPPPARGDVVVFDDEAKGLAVKVSATGFRRLIFQYQLPGQPPKTRRINLGWLGDYFTDQHDRRHRLTIASARKLAAQFRGDVQGGFDPFVELRLARQRNAESFAAGVDARREAREAKRRQREQQARDAAAHAARAVTFTECAADYIAKRRAGHVGAKARPLRDRGAREYERMVKRLAPIIGDRPVSALGDNDADAVRAAVRAPILANRVQQFAHAVVRHATVTPRIGPRWRDAALDNPFAGESWNEEQQTRQPLRGEAYRAVADAIAELRRDNLPGGAADALWVLLLTGWRPSEVLNLRWEHLDIAGSVASLPDTKTGQSIRPLSREVTAFLAALPRRGAYVFPSPNDPTRPRAKLVRAWEKVQRMTGTTAPLYALRHSFASAALTKGYPIALVGNLLGHRSYATTSRYAKLDPATATAAADAIAADLTSHPADVIPLRRNEPA